MQGFLILLVVLLSIIWVMLPVILVTGLIKPSLFTRFLKKYATRVHISLICCSSFVGVFILIGIIGLFYPSDGDVLPVTTPHSYKTESFKETKVECEEITPVQYEIAIEEDMSHKIMGKRSLTSFTSRELADLPLCSKRSYKIVVPPNIKEIQVTPTIHQIIKDITLFDPTIDEIIISLYSDKALANKTTEWEVAQAIWAAEGALGNITPAIASSNNRSQYLITIDIKENLEEYLFIKYQPAKQFGFSELQRRHIFDEFVANEIRAYEAAKSCSPYGTPNYDPGNLQKHIELSQVFFEKYISQAKDKHGLTGSVVDSIIIEGQNKEWLEESTVSNLSIMEGDKDSIYKKYGKTIPNQLITREKKRINTMPVEYEIANEQNLSHKAFRDRRLSSYTAQERADLPLCRKMSYKIIVSPSIKKYQVAPTIHKIIYDLTELNHDIDEITIYLYSSKDLVNDAWGWEVAKATWAEEGKLGNVTPYIASNNDRSGYRTTIVIKENLEEYLTQRNLIEEKFGFSEHQRRKIFKELIGAEDRANEAAEDRFPMTYGVPNFDPANWEKYVALSRELTMKYEDMVRLKYGISEAIEDSITMEGLFEQWPME